MNFVYLVSNLRRQKMNNETRAITFTADILKSVSIKNRIPIELVKYSFDIMLRNLEDLVKNSDTTSIFIPEIGTMYANYQRLLVIEKGMKKKNEDTSIVESKIKKIDDFTKKLEEKDNYKVNRHMQRKFLNNNFFTKGLKLEKIEELQNETGE